MPVSLGEIRHLFHQPQRGLSSVQASAALACRAGWGIEGDVHAHRLSPRQVLVTLLSELDALSIRPGALGENLVIAVADATLFRPGSALRSRAGVEIRLTMYCEPCEQIMPLVPDLRRMVHRRGILGTVARGGVLTVGEQLDLVAGCYPPLAASAFQRFLDFVPQIPRGKVVRYSDVALALGVADSYVRVLPGYIKRALPSGLPVHRIVNAQGSLLASIPDQAQRLAGEGVAADSQGKVDLAAVLWQG